MTKIKKLTSKLVGFSKWESENYLVRKDFKVLHSDFQGFINPE